MDNLVKTMVPHSFNTDTQSLPSGKDKTHISLLEWLH